MPYQEMKGLLLDIQAKVDLINYFNQKVQDGQETEGLKDDIRLLESEIKQLEARLNSLKVQINRIESDAESASASDD